MGSAKSSGRLRELDDFVRNLAGQGLKRETIDWAILEHFRSPLSSFNRYPQA